MVDLPSKVHDCIAELVEASWTVTEIVPRGEPRVKLTRQTLHGIDELVIRYRGTPSIIKDDTLGAWSLKDPHYQVGYYCSQGRHVLNAYCSTDFTIILDEEDLFLHAKNLKHLE